MSVHLPRLLQLASLALPVGAFSYSQGFEWAVESGAVRDEESARDWIEYVLTAGIAGWDMPYVASMLHAWHAPDLGHIAVLNEAFVASRETRELRSECVQMGRAMLEALRDWPGVSPDWLRCLDALAARDRLGFATGWTAAAGEGGVPVLDGTIAYAWSWLENTVMTAIKAVPLGQRAGQRLLLSLGERLPGLARAAIEMPVDQCTNFLPGFTLASMHHENQYTRLFRS